MASALQLFPHAKEKINDIFKDLLECIDELRLFLTEHTDGLKEKVEGFHETIQVIIEVLARDHMKVCFFGRTSNGKSSVINAMLGKKILPSGCGHITNCFLEVMGCDGNEGYLYTPSDKSQPPESNISKSVNSVKQLASALSETSLDENSLIQIYWPKEKCRLLKENVVFLDSPGIDLDKDNDACIDKFCLDADVFVLVVNSESSLTKAEKAFFLNVSHRLSKPNIFILQNRWDCVVLEEDAEKVHSVKKQHQERNVKFLYDELKVVNTKEEAMDMIFFVSAKEALITRQHEDNQTPIPTGSLKRGFEYRSLEFDKFEKKFEVCISKSAVENKLEKHTMRGKKVINDLRDVMKKTEAGITKQMEVLKNVLNEKRYKFNKQHSRLTTGNMQEEIRCTVEDISKKVSAALSQEIDNLSSIVETFQHPFDPKRLNAYRNALHSHVGNVVNHNLKHWCFPDIEDTIELKVTQLTERIADLLPEETQKQLNIEVPQGRLEITYRLDCPTMLDDFQEDIKTTTGFQDGMSKLLPAGMVGALTGTATGGLAALVATTMEVASAASVVVVAVAAAPLVTAAVVGTATMAVVGGSVYIGLSVLEKKDEEKEQEFKRLYVTHATSKWDRIVDDASSICRDLVQQRLSTTSACVRTQGERYMEKLQRELDRLDTHLANLKKASDKAKRIRQKCDRLDQQLNKFIAEFLPKPVA